MINELEADIVRKIFGWYIHGWSVVRIKKELEAFRIPSPRGKRRWPVSTIYDILTNEKYTGDSVNGRTVGAWYPAMKRIKNKPELIQRSDDHHPPIIGRKTFALVQEMKKSRSNIELDDSGNKVRKSTRYCMKRLENKTGESVQDV